MQARLEYSFNDTDLLDEAFVAAGAATARSDVGGPVSGNKRLALLGDAVLRLSILDEWYLSGRTAGMSETAYLKLAEPMQRPDTTSCRRPAPTRSSKKLRRSGNW